MGKLFYGNTDQPIDVPDGLLAHLKVVATTKLRRSESFTLSWRHRDDEPGGRTTIWLHSSIPLRFVFAGSEPDAIDPALLRDLANAANSSGGLTLDFSEEVSVADALISRVHVAHAA